MIKWKYKSFPSQAFFWPKDFGSVEPACHRIWTHDFSVSTVSFSLATPYNRPFMKIVVERTGSTPACLKLPVLARCLSGHCRYTPSMVYRETRCLGSTVIIILMVYRGLSVKNHETKSVTFYFIALTTSLFRDVFVDLLHCSSLSLKNESLKNKTVRKLKKKTFVKIESQIKKPNSNKRWVLINLIPLFLFRESGELTMVWLSSNHWIWILPAVCQCLFYCHW